MIQITIGGERRELDENITVSKLLTLENVEMPEYVSVSINSEFILRENFDTHILRDGDEVEFLYYMGGGAI